LDIADGILRVAFNLRGDSSSEMRGIFHMTGQGSATWADLAEAVFTESAEVGGPTARVRRIGTADYPTPARRPVNSRLNSSELERVHGVRLPEWRTSTKEVVRRLVQAR
jgi:dTDP-4-dehydrorhamnose reductase